MCDYDNDISVLVNGSPTEEFKMWRGTPQGDPLSPFHFLSVAEDLNVFMYALVETILFSSYYVGAHNIVATSKRYFVSGGQRLG